jgi:CheY-like chemotaxis protein
LNKQQPSILLVDDDVIGNYGRSAVLGSNGYSVMTAESPLRALELAASQRFSLVITDYDMPEMNGLVLASEIRAKGITTPILLLSGRIDAPPKATGIDDFICKGSGPEALLASVAKWAGRQSAG